MFLSLFTLLHSYYLGGLAGLFPLAGPEGLPVLLGPFFSAFIDLSSFGVPNKSEGTSLITMFLLISASFI